MIKINVDYIDLAIGGGLFPRKVVEVFGGESTAKSTLIQSFIPIWINQVDEIYYFDIEESLDLDRLKLMGWDNIDINIHGNMDIENLTDNIYSILDKSSKNNTSVLIIWDTLAATITHKGGLQKRPQMIRELLATIRGYMCNYYFIILNQVYDQIGNQFGGITSPGGRGLRHFTDLRIKLNRVSTIKSPDNRKVLGVEGKATIVKSKVSQEGIIIPYYFDTIYGFDKYKSIILFLKYANILISKAGGVKVIKFNDNEYKWQTIDQFIELYKDDQFRKILRFLTIKYYIEMSKIFEVKYNDEYQSLAEELGETQDD